MKKVIAILLVIASLMVISCGCGSDDNKEVETYSTNDYLDETYDSQESEPEEKELTAKECVPTPKEYIEKIKTKIPELSGLQLAQESSGETHYTNTGTMKNNTDAMMYNKDNAAVYLDSQAFIVSFSNGTNPELSITDRTSRTLNEMLIFVECFLEDYPLRLHSQEILSLYNQNATFAGGDSIEYETTVEDVTYKVVVSTSGYTKYIKITIN